MDIRLTSERALKNLSQLSFPASYKSICSRKKLWLAVESSGGWCGRVLLLFIQLEVFPLDLSLGSLVPWYVGSQSDETECWETSERTGLEEKGWPGDLWGRLERVHPRAFPDLVLTLDNIPNVSIILANSSSSCKTLLRCPLCQKALPASLGKT